MSTTIILKQALTNQYLTPRKHQQRELTDN